MATKKGDASPYEVREILDWILDNMENTEAMDQISLLVFPYTTKYKERNRSGYRGRSYHTDLDAGNVNDGDVEVSAG